MDRLVQSLLSAEPLDLARALAEREGAVPFLSGLSGLVCAERSLLDHVQRAMDALLACPPPPSVRADGPALRAWWTAMPDAYAAAFLRHVGLPEVCAPRRGGGRLTLPHARESVRTAREMLRKSAMPFAVREHALALVLNAAKATGLPGAGAPAETYMKLSCRLDLRALYHIERAELCALGGPEGGAPMQRLEAFRRQAERAGVFGRPHPPPLGAGPAREAGFEDEQEQHRALNALRYFDLVAGMREPDWFAERLRQERAAARGRLHLLVGPAGCGKSTWARRHLEGIEMVSSDRMREELTGNPGDQSQNYLVFQRCMDRVRTLLKDAREVVFDATNYSEGLRSMPVQAARWSAAGIVSYVFDVGLREAIRRNGSRPRKVPEPVIRKQFRLLDLPALYEADRHCVVDADGAVTQYWPAAPGT